MHSRMLTALHGPYLSAHPTLRSQICPPQEVIQVRSQPLQQSSSEVGSESPLITVDQPALNWHQQTTGPGRLELSTADKIFEQSTPNRLANLLINASLGDRIFLVRNSVEPILIQLHWPSKHQGYHRLNLPGFNLPWLVTRGLLVWVFDTPLLAAG